jgi:hypothetical protein
VFCHVANTLLIHKDESGECPTRLVTRTRQPRPPPLVPLPLVASHSQVQTRELKRQERLWAVARCSPTVLTNFMITCSHVRARSDPPYILAIGATGERCQAPLARPRQRAAPTLDTVCRAQCGHISLCKYKSHRTSRSDGAIGSSASKLSNAPKGARASLSIVGVDLSEGSTGSVTSASARAAGSSPP